MTNTLAFSVSIGIQTMVPRVISSSLVIFLVSQKRKKFKKKKEKHDKYTKIKKDK